MGFPTTTIVTDAGLNTTQISTSAPVPDHADNKDQSAYDPIAIAQRVPHTHSLTRDQKDAFDIRTYKADNKEIRKPEENHLTEPFSIQQLLEPRSENEPLQDPL